MKQFKIKDYSYFRDIILYVGTDDEIVAVDKKYNSDPSPGFKARLIYSDYVDGTDTPFRILLKLDDPTSPTLWEEATLAHEITHLVWHVLTDAGIPVTIDNEEVFAYYFQTIFAAMLHKLF